MPGRAKGQYGYTRREERLNFHTHLAALFASLVGSVVMISRAVDLGNTSILFGASLFSLTLICVFFSSSLYHGLPDGPLKQNAKKLDHISIYLIICGIYTALILAAAQNYVGLAVGVCVWVLGAWGTFKKFRSCPIGEKPNELPLYIAMACLVVPIFPFLDWLTITFLLFAAVFNISGLYFYRKKGKEFMHVVWHFFSLAASTCDYFAVLNACKLM